MPSRSILRVQKIQPVATGPLLPFITDDFAAGQLHQTSHSCIAQHFWSVKVYYADEAAVYFSRLSDCNAPKPAVRSRILSWTTAEGDKACFLCA